MREREREKNVSLFSLRIVFFYPTVFVVAIFTAALWCLFWWRRRRAFAKGAQRVVTTTIFDDFFEFLFFCLCHLFRVCAHQKKKTLERKGKSENATNKRTTNTTLSCVSLLF